MIPGNIVKLLNSSNYEENYIGISLLRATYKNKVIAKMIRESVDMYVLTKYKYLKVDVVDGRLTMVDKLEKEWKK